MGRKGKRRRRTKPAATVSTRPPSQLEPLEQETPAAEERSNVPAVPTSRSEPAAEGRPRGLFGRALGPESPYPPLGVSMARGLRPVAASPLILGATFLYLLAVWGFFAAAGAEPPTGLLAILTALPPVPSLFDSLVLLQETSGAVASLVLVLGVTIVRALALGAIVPLVVQAVGEGAVRPREALRGYLRRVLSLVGILSLEVALALLVFVLVQGFLGSQLAIFIVWLFGLQFLGMAPIVMVAEGAPSADSLRRSARAARVPGMRHFTLIIIYFFLLQIVTAAQGGAPFVATPTIPTWGFALFVSFVHVAVLGALAYRWLAVREQIPSGPVKRERTPR
ncbi:MAG TPA: hypothetical protein VGB51_01375 [Actinomycetota bacterium]